MGSASMKDDLEKAGKKYLPFPKQAQEVQILPYSYILYDPETKKPLK